MSALSLRFFGQFHVAQHERPITAFESDKVRALLAYLAVEAERAHARSTLAALLWPEYDEANARTNLRQALYQLRRVLGDIDNAAAWLVISRQSLQFNATQAYNCDVATFSALLQQCANHAHPQLEQCSACLRQMRQAVEVYQGDFLSGFVIDDSAPFEEWRRIKQEQFHLAALEALVLLADVDEANGEFERAQRYVRRQLTLEPWREEAHCQLMRLLARQGQRSAALAQYQSCRQVLAAELGVEPSAATFSLYEQIRVGKFADDAARANEPVPARPRTTLATVGKTQDSPAVAFALPAEEPAVTDNLPAQLTPFVGRGREVAELLARMQQPDLRLLTLVGPGGMGKTRLALEVARTRLGSHSAGIFFVTLAPLTSADAVAPAIAAAIGLELHGADPQQALLKFLRPKEMLLILDNFEHLLAAAGLVNALIQGARQLQIIATSRSRLNLQGEYFYNVQPLAFDAAVTDTSAPDIAAPDATASDAVRLFVQCAQRIHTGFQVDAANLPALLRICKLVAGMPLGLEMAAAWSEWLSLTEIASEIEKSSDFLTSEWPDAPARQRSMRAVFDWSWKLLEASEQQAFCRLAVFRGGFSRAAAEYVAGASLRTLISLTNKSLLYVTYPDEQTLPNKNPQEKSSQEKSVRYQVHELLRQFAAEQLEAQPDQRLTSEARHSDYYLTFVADRELRLARNEPRQAANEIQHELDNIRQAWLHAATQANSTLLDKSASTLARYYDLVGLINESVQALGQAIAQLENAGSSHQQLLSKLLAIQAAALMQQGNFDQGRTVAQRAVILGVAQGGFEGETYGQMVLGQWFHRKGQYAEARACFEQVLQLTERYQQHKANMELLHDAETTAYVWLGGAEGEMGNFAAAKARLSAGIRICQSLHKVHAEVHTRINLANLLCRTSDYAPARQLYEECLPITRALGYHWGEWETVFELGDTVRMLGEYSLANDLYQHAEAQLGKFGYTLEQLTSQLYLARLHCYLGAYDQARQWLDQAYQAPLLQESAWLKMVALVTRATLAQLTGAPEQAANNAQAALQLAESLDNAALQADGLLWLGHSQLGLQRWAVAVQSFQTARSIYQRLGNAAIAAEAKAALALLALAQGETNQAFALVEELLPLLQQSFQGSRVIGLDEPFFVYLACYRVLSAGQDQRATAVLSIGHAHLQHYAEQIHDEALRHSFLENVPVHRTIQEAFGEMQAWTTVKR